MKAVLLRIVMQPLWAAEFRDGILFLGLGIVLIPWTLLAVGSVAWGWKKSSRQESLLTAGTFAAVPAALYLFLPQNLRVEGIPIFGYGLMMFLGIVSATYFALRNGKLLGVSQDDLMDMAVWLVLPGILGGRVFYIVQKHNEHGLLKGKDVGEIFRQFINLPDGGLVFYGAIMGGLLGFLAYCHRNKHNVLLMGDIILPSVFVGLGFGRIGCFLYGCCYGGTCSLPWAVQFPKGSVPWNAQVMTGYLTEDAPVTLAIHPTQIYSSVNAFLLATVLMLYLRHRPYNGSVLAIGWIVYPIARFVIEILRNDEVGQFGFDATISQQISIALFVTGIAFAALLFGTRGRLFGWNKNPIASLQQTT